jgi:hypothetical protein
LPNALATTRLWRAAAQQAGLPGLYLCRVEASAPEHTDPAALGFDAAVEFQPDWTNLGAPLRRGRLWQVARTLRLAEPAFGLHRIYEYNQVAQRMLQRNAPPYLRFPGVTPSWDNSPRRQANAVILANATPANYQAWLTAALVKFNPPTPAENLVFINAWNEWGEGNHLEPDQQWGHAYLQATRAALQAAGGQVG